MKHLQHPEFHFSAYPLSVIGGTSQSRLKISKSPGGVSLKVLPPASPDKRKEKPHPKTNADAIQHFDVDWFNNYE